jgi:pimeloyl-ACP methyl ester carboxylesterase
LTIEKLGRTVEAQGLTLATEAFGDPGHPPALLIMGAMASMLWWPDAFCEGLARQGRYVIRYDNRDTGLSTTYAPGSPPYAMEDMADDAMMILDAYDIASADLIGMSMGGMIAQLAAFRHPARVRTLTLISTSPVGVEVADVPPMSEAYIEHGEAGSKVDWSDPGQVADYIVREAALIASTRHRHDEAAARAFIEADIARATNFASGTNHFLAEKRERWEGAVAALPMPVLVIHGTSDPVFPVEHGLQFAASLPGTPVLTVDGGGHELHPMDRAAMLDAIGGHLTAG